MKCPVTEGERPHGSRQPTAGRCGEWSGPAVDRARRPAHDRVKVMRKPCGKLERTRVAEEAGDTTLAERQSRCGACHPVVFRISARAAPLARPINARIWAPLLWVCGAAVPYDTDGAVARVPKTWFGAQASEGPVSPNHSGPRTTKLYVRRRDLATLSEIERRIAFA